MLAVPFRGVRLQGGVAGLFTHSSGSLLLCFYSIVISADFVLKVGPI